MIFQLVARVHNKSTARSFTPQIAFIKNKTYHWSAHDPVFSFRKHNILMYTPNSLQCTSFYKNGEGSKTQCIKNIPSYCNVSALPIFFARSTRNIYIFFISIYLQAHNRQVYSERANRCSQIIGKYVVVFLCVCLRIRYRCVQFTYT